jgi:hypothetical protein
MLTPSHVGARQSGTPPSRDNNDRPANKLVTPIGKLRWKPVFRPVGKRVCKQGYIEDNDLLLRLIIV